MKTLRDIAEEAHGYRRSINYSSCTEDRLRYMLGLFFKFLEEHFGVVTAVNLRPPHLHAYQEHIAALTNRKGLPLKAGSLNNRVKAVKVLTEFMFRRGYTAVDLSTHLRYVKEPKLLMTSVLTHRQVKEVIKKIDTKELLGFRDRTILELLYSTAVRNCELVGLTLDRVDLDSGLMRVLGKGNKERTVPVGRTALKWLTSYVRGIRPFFPGHREHREVFLSQQGKPLKNYLLRQIVRRRAGKANLDTVVTPHTFRRSCATEMIRGNANLYHVKELLGHESLDTLKAYTKLTINDLRRTHAKCHPREKDG